MKVKNKIWRKDYATKSRYQIAKEKKEIEHYKDKKVLRKYSKICKKEAIDSSRVKINSSHDNVDNTPISNEVVKINNPFSKELIEASNRIESNKSIKLGHEKVEKEINEKLKMRNKIRKMFARKNVKGPNIGGQINTLLEKIKKNHGV